MPPASNPLRKSAASGTQFNETLRGLFGKVGTSESPNGLIPAAYRNARRGLTAALTERNPRAAAGEVMGQLKTVIMGGMSNILGDAVSLGANEAKKQLGFYGFQTQLTRQDIQQLAAVMDPLALAAIESRIDAQIGAVDALLAGGIYQDLILGSGDRMGIIRPGEIQSSGIFWAAAHVWESFSTYSIQKSKGGGFRKQAVAALDERTTNCCLLVHGQIADLDKPFHLEGSPRYADEVDWPPFHDYCRTSGVLYLNAYDDGLTDEMTQSSRVIQAERAAGGTGYRHPADAFS